jgi:two-component system phosphate regulon sensor histidine kinase PhoR
MKNLSLRSKLLLAFWAVLCVSMVLPGLYVLHVLPGDLESVEVIRREFVLLLVLCFGLSFLLAVLLTRGFLKSIARITEVTRDIGRGELSRRLSPLPGKELSAVAESINQMAARIQQQMETVTEKNEMLSAVLDAMWDGVLMLDPKGDILAVNRSMADILPGIRSKTGRKPLEAVPSPELQQTCDEVLACAEKCSRSLTIDLREHIFEVSIVRVTQAPALGAVAIFHDISEQKKLERMRRDFVANVSHELRTPLTSVKGYTETLLSDEPPPPNIAKNFLGVILRNANHMAKMVDDLLSLSRLEGDKDPIKTAPMNPAGALLTAWEACHSLASSKNVALQQKLPEHQLRVMADPDQLARLFRNLLENAVKFTPENSAITVTADVVDNKARFAILDQGPGIPKKDQPRVFERFYSVEKHRNTELGSTGLGLAICRRIVTLHGGDIWLESPPRFTKEQDRGAAFLFTVPLAEAAEDA